MVGKALRMCGSAVVENERSRRGHGEAEDGDKRAQEHGRIAKIGYLPTIVGDYPTFILRGTAPHTHTDGAVCSRSIATSRPQHRA
jgi:hypothetical protein